MRLLILFNLLAIAYTKTFLRNCSKDINLFLRPNNFKCISIYGLETNLRNTVCSWVHPAIYYIDELKELGFNTIRVPISIQYVVEGKYDVLDSILSHTEKLGMQIFLDVHRVGNNRQEEDPDKGIAEYPGVSSRNELVINVIRILSRYEKNKALIAVNSWNGKL
jgi:aryl-phospho-beta-D-glucosidase BglC (GH1 family)